MVDELPEGYYLDNFHYLLNFVTRQYSSLLHSDEMAYARNFLGLHRESQMLYVRLIQRKGPLFRCDKLSYAEVPDLPKAINELTREGFFDDGDDASNEGKLGLLTKKELLDLPEARELDRSSSKVEILEELVDAGATLSAYPLVRPLLGDILQLYKLLFFGNLGQDFTEFVLNDLGVTPFENYPIDSRTYFFTNRKMVDQVLDLYELNEESYAIVEEGDVEHISEFIKTLPERASDLRIARKYDRILNRLARQYERLGMLDDALALYRKSQLPPARERQARILQKQGEVQLCSKQCLSIIKAPVHDEEYEFANRFLARHLQKHPGQIQSSFLDMNLLGFKPSVRRIFVTKDATKRVEEIACQWFRGQGQDAIYVENSLLPGLFGLAFWDIIFAPVAGAFFNPFQRGPTDMFSPQFFISRQQLIEQRMLELRDKENLKQIILDLFHAKVPRANHFVHWSLLTPELLTRFLAIIPVDALLTVFSRLLKDPANNRSGFPDLIVFEEDHYSFVEIKGPGDRLQNNQLRWLRHFDSVGIPAEVVHVSFDSVDSVIV